MEKTKRTYYGFQLVPSHPAGMDVVVARKPKSGYQVKCRASTRTEAREKINQIWHDECQRALDRQVQG